LVLVLVLVLEKLRTCPALLHSILFDVIVYRDNYEMFLQESSKTERIRARLCSV
jgi:hypothetical protein